MRLIIAKPLNNFTLTYLGEDGKFTEDYNKRKEFMFTHEAIAECTEEGSFILVTDQEGTLND